TGIVEIVSDDFPVLDAAHTNLLTESLRSFFTAERECFRLATNRPLTIIRIQGSQKQAMIIKITPIAIAVAAIGGLAVGYGLRSPSTPEIRHAIPVKHEVRKATAVDSETDFDEVNLPPDTEIRREKPVQPRVTSRRQAQQRLSNAEQVGILPNHRRPDTPKRE